MTPSRGTPTWTFRLDPEFRARVMAKARAEKSDLTKVTVWLLGLYDAIPATVKAAAAARAAREGTTLTAIIVTALQDYVEGKGDE